jgi:GTP-binding protein EngB required for normal cell division
MKEMNILFLGEPNVGKTTCINAIVDYMRCASFEEAEQFNMKSNHNVNEGTTNNEVTGYSKTEEPKAYVFEWGDTFVRLIDTPGIGDTRSKKQDKKNFDLILKYLTTLEDLHGVCILLKSNKSQLKVIYKLCIKELLASLHESASENIVFCFTKTGGTSYRQGETWPALRKLLADKKVNIDLSMHTLYSMDNDSFCDIHKGVKFDEDARIKNSEIWLKSVAETNRMLNHIASLKPQVISEDIISKHSVGKVITNITKPIDEIEKKLDTSAAVVEDLEKNIENVAERGSKVIKTINSIIKKFK